MRAIEFKIPRDSGKTIHIQHDRLDKFFESYHTHHELQLTYIANGHGTAFVGDSISSFEPEDVFLIGANLPHLFKSNEQETLAESYTFFFIRDFLGKDFYNLSSSKPLNDLLDICTRGIKLGSSNRNEIAADIKKGFDADILSQTATLLSILVQLSQQQNYITLAGPAFSSVENKASSNRMSTILNYLTSNYLREISLDHVASIANLSPTAFSRYFKQHTGKTYSGFLTEIRLSQAKKLLLNTDRSITEICFDSGFKNISNFNRQFKKHVRLSPRNYRRKRLTHPLIQK